MNNRCLSVSVATLLALGVGAADLTISGAYPVTVASGATTYLSDKVTGSGYLVVLGGGTLVLSNSANDFTGGAIVSNGVLQADAKGAFGTGPITLEGTAAVRTVKFNAQGAAFPNSITLKDAGTTSSNPAIVALKPVTLNGDFGIDPALAAANTSSTFCLKAGTSSADSNLEVVHNGDLDCGAAGAYFVGYGKFCMKGKLTVGLCKFGASYNEVGSVALYNPDNRITRIHLFGFDIICRAANVFKGANVFFDWADSWGYNGHGFIQLGGFDQEITYATSRADPLALAPNDYACGFINDASSAPMATLTITGQQNADSSSTCYGRLTGKIALRVTRCNPNQSLWQRFRKRTNSMTGGITVDDGQLRIENGVTFTAVTNITINGGSMRFEAATNAFPVLRSLVVKETMEFIASCKNPINSRNAIMELAADAHLYVGTGVTNTVRRLVVNGTEMKAGTYTRENLPQMLHATTSQQTKYSGALVVLSGPKGMAISFR